MRILTVNGGSTSLKLERYDFGEEALPKIADPPSPAFSVEVDLDGVEHALADAAASTVDAVAHRFVRLPEDGPAAFRLDPEALRRIAAVAADDPLHDAAAMAAVFAVERVQPGVAQFAVSDSAFHRTMAEAATTYALPRDVTRSGLRRLGFHGLSHEYAAHRGCSLAGLDVARTRVVSAHLGGGSSLCAILNGSSVDTTMGFTPLEGVPMATRSGSVDPGLLIHLLRSGTSIDELEQILERRSGLLGMSGVSADVRELLAAGDDPGARLALDVLGWRVRAAFGAMVAALGGVDLLVFTGGIGEHAPTVRAAALDGGLGLSIRLDAERSAEGVVSSSDSLVPVVVVAAREGWQLAREVYAIARFV